MGTIFLYFFFLPQLSSRYNFCRHELFVNSFPVKILYNIVSSLFVFNLLWAVHKSRQAWLSVHCCSFWEYVRFLFIHPMCSSLHLKLTLLYICSRTFIQIYIVKVRTWSISLSSMTPPPPLSPSPTKKRKSRKPKEENPSFWLCLEFHGCA